MIRLFTFTLVLLLAFAGTVIAQKTTTGIIEGTVYTKNTGVALPGATVAVMGTKMGARSDENGDFKIEGLQPGNYTIRVTFVGYAENVKQVTVNAGAVSDVVVQMSEVSIQSRAISVVASRAEFRETPVAFSNVTKEDMDIKLGSRDIPLILNETPGVYATEQGGGAGDSRINIRGFDQRNISVMINGVPVNDMENGWVYWSNWDGLGDVTSSIQVQRGLGAGKIANPSVGGTMNIITDPANLRAGGKIKQEYGSGNFLKTTVVGNTGLLDNGFAASAAVVYKSGEGIIDGTWTDAYAYYLGMSYSPNEDHSLEFYLIGAPQQHGQRTWSEPIEKYDAEYAGKLGINTEAAENYGIEYNSDWGEFNTDQIGKVYYRGAEHDPKFSDQLNERANYYHKPQANLNWFWQINEKTSLTNVFYLSIGSGGGSGSLGNYFYNKESNGQIDWQGIYNTNTSNINPDYSTTENASVSILRNSVNNHFWVGWLGTADIRPTDNLTLQIGGDVRYYEGEHFREVRNLLGGDYFVNTSDNTLDYDADPSLAMKRLGDKLAYHNDGLVQWIGGFAQGEYSDDLYTLYLNTSFSNTGYKRIDYFRNPTDPNGRETDWENILGYTVKTGANFNVTQNVNLFGNIGLYNRAPGFDAVYYYDNSKYENVENEKVYAAEIGTGYWSREFRANVNVYYTSWVDRAWPTSTNYEENGQRVYVNYLLRGIDAVHQGVEIDFTWRPSKNFKFYSMMSFGDWEWTNDVEATYSPEDNPSQVDTTFVYANGLKVGDAAQKTLALSGTWYPIEKSYINVTYKYFMDNYADFDPEDRDDPNDRALPWRMPDFGLLNLHAGFTIPVDLPMDITLKASIFNLLDVKYIADARDGSAHNADAATVYFGRPLWFNLGVEIEY